MEQKILNRMDGDQIAQEDLAISIELILAANDSVFHWMHCDPVAHIIPKEVKPIDRR